MGNLIDIQSQIEKLQKQAADIRSREFTSTVQDILAKMQAFGITVKDLSAGLKKTPKTRGRPAGKVKVKVAGTRRAAKKSAGTSTVAPKYQGPNGETWTGRGLMPRWMSTLVAEGRAKDDFLIKT
ncbi:MAG: H-NS histone family protein [Betaproteobacteria bacterium]